MQSIRLHIWQEQIPLEDAFGQLRETGLEMPVLKELGKRILYLRSFAEYTIAHPPAEELDGMQKQFFERSRLTTQEQIDRWYQINRQSPERLRRQLTHQNQLNRLKQVVVSEEMMKEAFLKRKPKLDSMTFGLIRVDTEALAKELYYRLRDDHQDFGELAKEFSVGPEGPSGGMVGPRPVGDLNPELRKHLMPMNPGETTPPFTLDDKVFIIARLFRADNAQLNPQLEANIREDLFEQWTDRQLGLAEMSLLMPGEDVSDKTEAQPAP